MVVIGTQLTSGKTKSCGCYQKEATSNVRKKYNDYDLSGDYGIGYDCNGMEFYFDLEDYDLIKDYCWSVDPRYGYVDCRNENCRLHRLVMSVTNKYIFVDHINHKCNDNRKINLRLVSNGQNQMNKSLNSNKKYNSIPGVSWHSRDCVWRAYITVNGKNIHLGTFYNKEDAENARIEAEQKYFGEYSYRESMRYADNYKMEEKLSVS